MKFMLVKRLVMLTVCLLSALVLSSYAPLVWDNTASARAESSGVESGSAESVLPTIQALLSPMDIPLASTVIDGEAWLFLPAYGDMTRLRLSLTDYEDAALYWEGTQTVPYAANEPLDWLTLSQETEAGVHTASLIREATGEALLTLHVMQSANLRALYLWSDDPEQCGREWLEDCERHERSTTASMALISAEGRISHAGDITKLRGRGNGTWEEAKRGYQFKLDIKADLLDTGMPDERNKTWVLLANASDPTMLHNRIALDMGLELGLQETSHSEYVDLYYDGDYRGTYLLCEKVEVNQGRVDVLDYETILKRLNNAVGQRELDELSIGEAVNSHGNAFTYAEGLIESNSPADGSYLIEMESAVTLNDRCHFSLSDGSMYAVKNPENASQAMMNYVSTRLEEAWQAVSHRGVNPATGLGIDDYFDVDSFARLALLHELSQNFDGFHYSSTYFVLPAGEGRFTAGPPWDFDLAFAPSSVALLEHYPNYQDDIGFKESAGWLSAFYTCQSFRDAMQVIYRDELYPMLQSILLGGGEGRYLRSLESYQQEIAASQAMNYRLWSLKYSWHYQPVDSFDAAVEQLRAFVRKRGDWLSQALAGWSDFDPSAVALTVDAMYTQTEDTLRLLADNTCRNGVVSSFELAQVREADENAYALWQVQAIIAPLEGQPFGDDPAVTVNGYAVTPTVLEDGALSVTFTFEDPSYRPVDYYGEDIGLVYDPAAYAANYPELAAEYADDPEGLMEYFYYDGMMEGHKGNAFFDPQELYLNFPDIADRLWEDWPMYYLDFMSQGDTIFWMNKGMRRYTPEIVNEGM